MTYNDVLEDLGVSWVDVVILGLMLFKIAIQCCLGSAPRELHERLLSPT